MDKEQQIEEMAKDLFAVECKVEMCEAWNCNGCDYEKYRKKYFCDSIRKTKAFYDAGYRKQSEVAKEFVDRLILELIALRSEEFDGKELAINGKTYKYLVMRAKEIAAEYGVEVEK